MIDDGHVTQAIRQVLGRAAKGKDAQRNPKYVTAYQILNRLPKAMRTRLIDTFGNSGAGVGHSSGAAKHIADLIKGMGGIDVEYPDTRGIKFCVSDEEVKARNQVCGLYRLSRP